MAVIEPRRLCLRCDWEGSWDGPACPECGVPLYQWSGPRAAPPNRHEPRPGDAIEPPAPSVGPRGVRRFAIGDPNAHLMGGKSPVVESGVASRHRSFSRPVRLLAVAAAVAGAAGLLWGSWGSVESVNEHPPGSGETYVYRNLRNGEGWRPPPIPPVGQNQVYRNLRDGAGWVAPLG